MNALHLVHGHSEVVGFSKVEREGVVPEPDPRFGVGKEGVVQVEIQLVPRGKGGAVEGPEADVARREMVPACGDTDLGIVRPTVVVARGADQCGDLRILGDPSRPVLFKKPTKLRMSGGICECRIAPDRNVHPRYRYWSDLYGVREAHPGGARRRHPRPRRSTPRNRSLSLEVMRWE